MSDINAYLDEQGRVTQWPTPDQREAQRQVRDYLAQKIETGKEFAEEEIDAILNQWHVFGDPALLRHELAAAGWLKRTLIGGKYRRIAYNRM